LPRRNGAQNRICGAGTPSAAELRQCDHHPASLRSIRGSLLAWSLGFEWSDGRYPLEQSPPAWGGLHPWETIRTTQVQKHPGGRLRWPTTRAAPVTSWSPIAVREVAYKPDTPLTSHRVICPDAHGWWGGAHSNAPPWHKHPVERVATVPVHWVVVRGAACKRLSHPWLPIFGAAFSLPADPQIKPP
jgi:hypothetical protein